MRGSIRWKVNVGFGLTLAVLAAISLLSYHTISRLVETVHLEVHSHEVLNQLDDLFVQLQNAETGQRGFVITGEERYLEPYQTALRRIDEERAKLQSRSADHPSRQRQLGRLDPLIAEKLEELNDTIAIRRSQGFDAALAIIVTDRGKRVMDEIRGLMEALEDEEHALLLHRDEEATRVTRLATSLLLLLTALNAGLVGLAVVMINRDVESGNKTEAAIRRANEQLEH